MNGILKREHRARRHSRSFQPILNREASPDARLENRVSASSLHGGPLTGFYETEQAQAPSNGMSGAILPIVASSTYWEHVECHARHPQNAW